MNFGAGDFEAIIRSIEVKVRWRAYSALENSDADFFVGVVVLAKVGV